MTNRSPWEEKFDETFPNASIFCGCTEGDIEDQRKGEGA